MEDMVWSLALFVSTMSGGACDVLSAVRDSKILMRDSRLLLSLVVRLRCSTVLVKYEMVVRCLVAV